mgnify:FL=1
MKKITLQRSWFVTNLENDNEFDYVLRELQVGSSDAERDTVEEIEITYGNVEITEQDHSPIDNDNYKQRV